MKGRGIKGLLFLTAAWTLAVPADADATRYAIPGGSGPEPCAIGAPCSIHTAVEAAPGGETVILRSTGATYNVGADTVNVPNNVAVIGEPGQPRPTISSSGAGATGAVYLLNGDVLAGVRVTAANGIAVNASNSGATVRDSYLEADAPSSYVIDLRGTGALLERSQVVAPSGSMTQFAVLMGQGATLRDTSVFQNGPSFGAGITFTSGASTVRNATVIATGATSDGMFSSSSWAGLGAVASVTVANSIIDGASDIRMSDEHGTTENVTITITHSSYSTFTESAPQFDLIPVAPNQDSAATPSLLSHPGVPGDFHQLAGSPTVDAGVLDGSTGNLDFEGQPRIQGGGIDIGADELAVPTVPAPVGVKGPPPTGQKKKCKKGRKLKKNRCVKKKRKKRKK